MSKMIGYCKFGRSMGLNPAKYGPQGDAEAPNLLWRLARRNPDVTWVLVGRHNAYEPGLLPPNVIDPWEPKMKPLEMTEKALEMGLDGVVVHLGQHGTSHIPLPMSGDRWDSGKKQTEPLVWARNYGEYLSRILNGLGDATDGASPVSWIITDPRNYFKARDIKWPTGLDRILAQHEMTRTQIIDRHQDPRRPEEFGYTGITTERDGELWRLNNVYRHANLELMMLGDHWASVENPGFEDRSPAGIATSSYFDPKDHFRRSWLVKQYFTQLPQFEVYGKWDTKSMADAEGFEVKSNTVAEFDGLLQRWRITAALPPATRSLDGIQWTTAKPMQCFAASVACFFIGDLDKQGWLLPSKRRTPEAHEVGKGLWSVRDDWTDNDLILAQWLRVDNPEQFRACADNLSNSRESWEWIVAQQRSILERRWAEQYTERIIEHQMGLTA